MHATPTMRTCAYCHAPIGMRKGKGINTPNYCSNYHRTAAWRVRHHRKGGINKRTGERM